MQTRDVDTLPDLPWSCVLITVQANAVATSDKENVGVCKDRGTAVPMGSKSFNADHALGLSLGRPEFQTRWDTCG